MKSLISKFMYSGHVLGTFYMLYIVFVLYKYKYKVQRRFENYLADHNSISLSLSLSLYFLLIYTFIYYLMEHNVTYPF